MTDVPSLLPPAGVGPATDFLHSAPAWKGLSPEATRIGLCLEASALTPLERFRDLLLARNAQFNLTAIRQPAEVERRLILDALAILPALDEYLRLFRSNHAERPRLIDVGSGAGFPGMVLKIARPDLDVTLVDATNKKVRFLEEVISNLGLESARAIHGRAEVLGQDPTFRERFDVATARAVATLPTLLELVVPFLEVGGRAFFPKGTRIDDELQAGDRAASLLGTEIVSSCHMLGNESRLVVVTKATRTPKRYPRRTGVPNQTPLGAVA